jgi:hypothetical protein
VKKYDNDYFATLCPVMSKTRSAIRCLMERSIGIMKRDSLTNLDQEEALSLLWMLSSPEVLWARQLPGWLLYIARRSLGCFIRGHAIALRSTPVLFG